MASKTVSYHEDSAVSKPEDSSGDSSRSTVHNPEASHVSFAASHSSGATIVESRKGGILKSNVSLAATKTERRLNAAAGLVDGEQADCYNVGDLVFVKHVGWPWPARIEDPSNVDGIVTRFQYAAFLYGVHERKVVKLQDIFLYDENKDDFATKTDHHILNTALYEIENDPEVNLQIVPPHKKRAIQYLRRSRSHALLASYFENHHLCVEETGDHTTITDSSTSKDECLFSNTRLISQDSCLGFFTILSSLVFMCYLTWWLVLMPFLEPSYLQILEQYFPIVSQSIFYPIAAGTTLVSSIIASFGAITYGPRVNGAQWVLITPHNTSAVERRKRLTELISTIEHQRPAIFILVAIALFVYTPAKVFAVTLILFGSLELIFNFIVWL